uniref:AlNc14C454G11747 protein n=1 Tax=Albugo laibachii Nc14 TaxID=890382 RepID=F0X006_9STRA|nr:AlNc14C454G11747 [Albugo laibachii Nc14]|eukprot:CCA27087.1 AlNc14C454G11747 [Albugo laibachii Nc14]
MTFKEQFTLLMLFYDQQYTKMIQNEKCRNLAIYQVSRWWIHMPMETVKTLVAEAAWLKIEMKIYPLVSGTVKIKNQLVDVEYTFNFKIYDTAVDLIKILNKGQVHTAILTGAEQSMMSHISEHWLKFKCVFGVEYTHGVPGQRLNKATFIGLVDPSSIPLV